MKKNRQLAKKRKRKGIVLDWRPFLMLGLLKMTIDVIEERQDPQMDPDTIDVSHEDITNQKLLDKPKS